MPPVLDPTKSKVDGLAFLGLSLTRHSDVGHPDSVTHQTAFDLNSVLDREYENVFSTNDDGWLAGGGEPGPPLSYKLSAKDSSHVEIMRIGTYRSEWGGVPLEEVVAAMAGGDILIPQIDVVPTAVVANGDVPPELEVRFDMDPSTVLDDPTAPLPINWQLRFLHNQLFRRFEFPSRFCPGAFHSTIVRKAEFRSDEHRARYFAKCDAAVRVWRERGPQPLNTVPRALDGRPLSAEERAAAAAAAAVVASEPSVHVEAVVGPPDVPAASQQVDAVIVVDKKAAVASLASNVAEGSNKASLIVEESPVPVKDRVAAFEAANGATTVVAEAAAAAADHEESPTPPSDGLASVQTQTTGTSTAEEARSEKGDEAEEKKEEDNEAGSYYSRPPPLDDPDSPLAPPPHMLPSLDSMLHSLDIGNDDAGNDDGDLSPEAFVAKAMTNLEVSLEDALDVPDDGPAATAHAAEAEAEEDEEEQEAYLEEEQDPADIPLSSPTSMAAVTTNLEVCLDDAADGVVLCDEDLVDDPASASAAAIVPEGDIGATFYGSIEKVDTASKEEAAVEKSLETDHAPGEEANESLQQGEAEVTGGEDIIVAQDELAAAAQDDPQVERPSAAQDDVQAESPSAAQDDVHAENPLVDLEDVVPTACATVAPAEYHSGIWLFSDRENITHFFKPNFLPPYDTPEKRRIILDVLREEWDESALSWKPCGQGSMTKTKVPMAEVATEVGSAAPKTMLGDVPHLKQLDQFVGGILSSIDGICSPPARAQQSTTAK